MWRAAVDSTATARPFFELSAEIVPSQLLQIRILVRIRSLQSGEKVLRSRASRRQAYWSSTSSFTRGAFGSDLTHNSLDLLHSHRFARERAEIPRHLKEIALIAVFPNFARDQLTQVGSIEQAFRARFRRDFLWQIEFDRDAYDNSTVTETNTGCQVTANSALKHHHQEAEFYADVLSHLLKNKLKLERKVVLNIAQRSTSYTKRKSSTCVAKSSRALRENGERRARFPL